jgi:hypothetical protein
MEAHRASPMIMRRRQSSGDSGGGCSGGQRLMSRREGVRGCCVVVWKRWCGIGRKGGVAPAILKGTSAVREERGEGVRR